MSKTNGLKQAFPNVWKRGRQILTKNLVPGSKGYTEQLLKINKTEYRVWDPNRSKPAAAIAKGLKTFPLKTGMKILYLGIASGQTASYFSDIIGKDGIIYGVEISERTFRELNPVAEKRGNMVPILANARKPQDYEWIEAVDLVFQDVATDDQSEILIRNCKAFLKPAGTAMLSLKSRSIDVTKNPDAVYKQEEAKLKKDFKIVEKVRLDPYEKDHMFYVLKPLKRQ
jgi:fibrillarin-like pre-rRNA processing protein